MEDMRRCLKDLIREKSLIIGDFTLSSGKKSTYYIDGKMTSFDSEGAFLIGQLMFDEIAKLPVKIDSVGGPTIGADPLVTGIGITAYLNKKSLGLFVVRKDSKKHGTQKSIEGNFKNGDRVVIVEDVMTTGRSLLRAVDAVEESGGIVEAVVVVVDRQQGGKEAIEKRGYTYKALFEIGEFLD